MSFTATSPPFEGIAFEHEQSATFADYWHSLPKQELIPSRRDFDPGAQAAVLNSYIIHELVSPEMIRIRLVGTKHREGFGTDPTGRNYLDFVQPKRRAKAARARSISSASSPAGCWSSWSQRPRPASCT